MLRLTTPRAPSPKSLSFSFKHTATGVFLLDSLKQNRKEQIILGREQIR